ncbi:MAG: Deoxyribose-phosphate aldolase [Chlamydiae bacterium]|nr:Deoxyribose-phosphate aldolase [Chlamydiota bacterium]
MKIDNPTAKTFPLNKIAAICDHTFLTRTEAYRERTLPGKSSIKRRQADFFQFLRSVCHGDLQPFAVCVRAEDIPHAYRFLEENNSKEKVVLVATVGFPEGAWYKTQYKLFETQYAMGEGADEIDMVLNYQALKEGNHARVLEEMQVLKKVVDRFGGKLKVILETSELSDELIAQACHLAAHGGADFVKTSTGFATTGVKAEQLKVVCNNFAGGIKISGGINAQNVQHFLSIISNSRPGVFALDPAKVRIGESQLLYTP